MSERAYLQNYNDDEEEPMKPEQAAALRAPIERLKRQAEKARSAAKDNRAQASIWEGYAEKDDQEAERFEHAIAEVEGETAEALKGWLSPDEARAIKEALLVACGAPPGNAATSEATIGSLIAELVASRERARSLTTRLQDRVEESERIAISATETITITRRMLAHVLRLTDDERDGQHIVGICNAIASKVAVLETTCEVQADDARRVREACAPIAGPSEFPRALPYEVEVTIENLRKAQRHTSIAPVQIEHWRTLAEEAALLPRESVNGPALAHVITALLDDAHPRPVSDGSTP